MKKRKLSRLDRALKDLGACTGGIRLARGKSYKQAWDAAIRRDKRWLRKFSGAEDYGIAGSYARWLANCCALYCDDYGDSFVVWGTPLDELKRPTLAQVQAAAREVRGY